MTPTKAAEADPRRWLILAVIAVAQLMVVLDATIVNIALPSAQRDLAFSTPDRQWVLTAYTLAFGGLLLVGGRLSDLIGRRTTFIAGLIGFAGRPSRRCSAVRSMPAARWRPCREIFSLSPRR